MPAARLAHLMTLLLNCLDGTAGKGFSGQRIENDVTPLSCTKISRPILIHRTAFGHPFTVARIPFWSLFAACSAPWITVFCPCEPTPSHRFGAARAPLRSPFFSLLPSSLIMSKTKQKQGALPLLSCSAQTFPIHFAANKKAGARPVSVASVPLPSSQILGFHYPSDS